MRGDGEGTTTTIVVAGTMATKAVVVEMAGVGKRTEATAMTATGQ